MIRLQKIVKTDRGDTYQLSDGTLWLRTHLFEDAPEWEKGTWLRLEPKSEGKGVGTTHVLVAVSGNESVEVAPAE